jgi:hypothetical protein
MRVVSWAEFKTLPVGTIFQELGGGNIHDGLQILGGFLPEHGEPNDFVVAELMPQLRSSDTFGAFWKPGPDHVAGDFYVTTPDGYGRDGLYQHEQRRWLIWDVEDRARLAGWLLDPASAASIQNDDQLQMRVSFSDMNWR